MKSIKVIFITAVVLLGMISVFGYSHDVAADTYTIGNYVVTEQSNVISVTDEETGLSAYLDLNSGALTDVNGVVSYTQVGREADDIPSVENTNILSGGKKIYGAKAVSGFRRGVWNYVTTHSYNLGQAQSIQARILQILAVFSGPAAPYISGAAGALGLAATLNQNVTIQVSQYYDPAQPTKIKEVIVTYANGRRVGSTSYVRNIY